MRNQLIAIPLAAALALAGGCHFLPYRQEEAVDHYVQGQLLADQGKIDAALRELAAAVKADPDLSVAHSAIGDLHRKRGDYRLAERSYRHACDANPYAFRPHYHLGVVYQALAEAADAAKQVEDYLREAVGVYLRAVTLEPDDFDTNLNLSACYYSLGKLAVAEKYCKAAIAVKADSPEAYSNLGIIYDRQGRVYEAIKAYKDSLELDVHQPRLLMNLGATYMGQGRLNLAMRSFELATREAPDDADAWEQLGSCHYHRKDYDAAMAAYEKAVALDKTHAAAHRGIGVVYMTRFILDRGNVALRDKALAAWHASLELDPDQEEVLRLVRKYAPTVTGPDL